MQIKRYKNEFDYSYTLGIFPTIELLKSKPESVLKIFVSKEIEKSEGYKIIKLLCSSNNIEIEINERVIKTLSDKSNVYAIGVFNKYRSNLIEGESVVVLVNPENAGNVGTIIRTMIGMGIKNLALIKPAVDTFNPDLIRASMGSLFKVNFEYFESLKDYLRKTKNVNYFISKEGEDIREVKIEKPYSLIFGSESSGLGKEEMKNQKILSIKMSEEIDSYNLAVSVGIALFQAQK